MQDAPELLPGLSLYYDAFVTLMSDRGDMGIHWMSMRAYCSDYGIVGEQREYFYDLVRALDQAFMKHQAKKAKEPPKAPPART